MSEKRKYPKREKTESCKNCGGKFTKQGLASHAKHCGKKAAAEVEKVVAVRNDTEPKRRMVSEWDDEFSSRPVVVFKRETASEKLMNNISEKLPEIIGMLSPLIASAAEALVARSQGSVPEEASYDTSAALPAEQIVAPAEEPKPKRYYNFSNFP